MHTWIHWDNMEKSTGTPTDVWENMVTWPWRPGIVQQNPVAVMETSLGDMEAEHLSDKKWVLNNEPQKLGPQISGSLALFFDEQFVSCFVCFFLILFSFPVITSQWAPRIFLDRVPRTASNFIDLAKTGFQLCWLSEIDSKHQAFWW